MTFEEDLTKRRIDVTAFAAGDPDRFADWQRMYSQMHPNSFYVSIKMVINDVRRRFWLAEAVKPVVPASAGEAPARPAGRRVAIPAVPKPAVVDITPEPEKPQPVESSPAPGRARPVIRKPVPANEAAPVENAPENPSPAESNPASEPAKPAARPRPVFKKPVSTEATPPVLANSGQVADEINPELAVHTNPVPAQGEDAAVLEPIISQPNPPVDESVAATTASAIPDEPSLNEKTEVLKTPPRPRPVFKRPAPAATGPVVENSLPVTNSSLPRTAETEGNIADVPGLEGKVEQKSPRPRPIFKKPVAPVESSGLANSTQSGPVPVKPDQEEPNFGENIASTTPEAVEPPKPPRPRPVFKRPGKPQEPLI